MALRWAFLLNSFLGAANAALTVTQTDSNIILQNNRFKANLQKSRGSIVDLTLDGQDLLGPQSGSIGIGPYLDCYCIPSGFYTAGSSNPTYQVIKGVDSTGTAYGGIVMSDTYKPTGQGFHQFWFLRDGETGLHMFSRLTYFNETTPFLRNLQELRTLLRPNTNLWTHLSTNKEQTAPLPSKDAVSKQVVAQVSV
jgi:rhamnogalacturonan endolyase